MDKIAIAILVILIIIAGLGLLVYFGQIKIPETNPNPEDNSPQESNSVDSALKGLLPEIQTNTLENKPNINPVDAANPVQNIKTNPFE